MDKTNKSGSDEVSPYGLLAINHAYNQGKITFKQWLELSRKWAVSYKEQLKGRDKKKNK